MGKFRIHSSVKIFFKEMIFHRQSVANLYVNCSGNGVCHDIYINHEQPTAKLLLVEIVLHYTHARFFIAIFFHRLTSMATRLANIPQFLMEALKTLVRL